MEWLYIYLPGSEHGSISGSSLTSAGGRRPTSIILSDGQKTSDASIHSESGYLSPACYQAGKAEALGALCR